jgi:glycerol 3-phosphatase-1
MAAPSPASEEHTFDGILFDLDGTIVDSTNAIIKHWHKCVPLTYIAPNTLKLTFPESAPNSA